MSCDVVTSVTTCGIHAPMQVLGDTEALNAILGSLPGVNPDDPALQTALRNLQGSVDKDTNREDAGEKNSESQAAVVLAKRLCEFPS